MSRPHSNFHGFFTRRESLRLLLLIIGLVLVIQTMDRLRKPGAMNWLFEEKVQTELESPIAELGDEQPAPVEDELQKGADQAGEDAPKPLSNAEAKAAAAFNPLGLELLDELQTVNPAYLEVVQDEIDPQRRRKVTYSEIRERRAKANDAVYQILGVASTTPPDVLAKKSRTDVFLSNLWKDPDTYRGQLIHIDGVLHRLETVAEGLDRKNPYGIDKIYEAWVFIPELQAHLRAWFTSLPDGLSPELSLKENVSFDAYFLKLYAYQAQDEKWHAVPMLLGFQPSIKRIDTGPMQQQARNFSIAIAVLVVLGMALYIFMSYKTRREAEQLRAAVMPRANDVNLFESPASGPSSEGSGDASNDVSENPYTRG